MKITRFILTAVLWIGLLAATRVAADTYYVATNGTGNGTTWALATSNIQAAVDASTAGDSVLVSNGTYYCWSNSSSGGANAYTSMVTVTEAITIQSVNGPATTIVDGNYPAITNRCFYISSGGTVSGFTITNGHTADANSGGGVFINTSGMVTNCWITGNSATNGLSPQWSGGGGIHLVGRGAKRMCRQGRRSPSGSTPRSDARAPAHRRVGPDRGVGHGRRDGRTATAAVGGGVELASRPITAAVDGVPTDHQRIPSRSKGGSS